MTHVLHRSSNAAMLVAVSGSGIEIVEAEGRRHFDASGRADLMAVAKGLGGGYQQIGAVMLTRRMKRSRAALAPFSTAPPIWAIRWPLKRRCRYRMSSGGIRCPPTWSRWAEGLSGGSRRGLANTRLLGHSRA
jgi:hypothetical protein